MTLTTLHLTPQQFTAIETPLIECGALSASLFRYPGGVCALRLRNGVGELLLLPFQGQQVWRALFGGRDLTMRTIFEQPVPTRDFLATFGSYLVHCGASAMGSPGPGDTHPLHGELPNAPYQSAQLLLGADQRGEYIALTGSFTHRVFFSQHFRAQPLVKLYAGQSVFDVSMSITNLKATPMELMYLAHINVRPVDNGRLVYSTPADAAHMRVRASIPGHVTPQPGYAEFLELLKAHPGQHQVLKPGLAFDPEVVFFIDYQADEEGWARALHIHPDGSADVVRQRLPALNRGMVWISRTPDQDALGFEPATAQVEGYSAEKRKGNLRILAPGEVFTGQMQAGYLNPDEVQAELKRIEAQLKK